MSLRVTIIMTICGIVLLSSMAMTVIFVSKSEELTESIARTEIQTQAELLAARMENSLSTIASELSMLSHLNPVRALSEDHDDLGGSDTSALRQSEQMELVKNIFSSLLEERPYYTQVRLLEVSGRGRELVRVNRNEAQITPVAFEQLQEKAGEPYFSEALSFFPQQAETHLATGHEKHFAYLSEVTLNREHGVVAEPKTAVLRFIEPVYSDDGLLAGLLIINTNYGGLLYDAFQGLRINHQIFIFNENLDYIEYSSETGASKLEFHQYRINPVPALLEDAALHSGQRVVSNADDIAVQTRFNVNGDVSRFIGVLVQANRSALLAGMSDLNTFGLALSASLVGFALVLAWGFAERLTKPLLMLTNSIVRAKEDRVALNLTTARPDEIGTLAREFQELYTQLSDSEIKSRLILNNLGEGIIAIQTDGTIVDSNTALERIFGYDANELHIKNVSCLMPQDVAEKHDGYLDRYAQTQKRNIDWNKREEIGQKKTGECFPIELTVTDAELDKETIYIGILRDISERRAVEKAKSEFLATVSHELRTPLASLIGAIGLLEAVPEDAAPEQRKSLLTLANRNAKRLKGLVEDILDFESYTYGIARQQNDILDLNELLEEAVEMVMIRADTAGVGLKKDLPSGNLQVRGDQKRLLQALTNILNNAVKFSHTEEDVWLKTEKDSAGENIAIIIEDRGIGIPEDQLERIFDSFVQVDSSNTRNSDGVGLGLAIAQKIVQSHGGKVTVASKVGVGTTFRIEIPLVQREPALA